MILQPLLKVSVLDASIYGLSASVSPSLMWWKPRLQIMPSSAKLQQDLGPRKVIIYVYEDVFGLHRSSRGPLPLTSLRCEVAPLETVWDSDETLVVSMKHRLLDCVSMGIP